MVESRRGVRRILRQFSGGIDCSDLKESVVAV